MTDPISIRGLTKKFGSATALAGLDLSVAAGEVHGFLGPNGAGKSTTLRVLLGSLRADAGTVELLGGDPWDDATALHPRLAYVPGDVTLWPGLSGGEVIDLLLRIRTGKPPSTTVRGRRAALIERFDLNPRVKCRTYSKGNRQKVALIAALAADVELLLLDEPTSGLDPLMEAVFRDVILEHRQRGEATVLLSSHILSEVESLCERVTIIRAGRRVDSGSLAELRHLTRTTVRAEITGDAPALYDLAGVHNVTLTNGMIQFTVDPDAMGAALRLLATADVRGLISQPPTLEELFLRHYSTDDLATTDSAADRAGVNR